MAGEYSPAEITGSPRRDCRDVWFDSGASMTPEQKHEQRLQELIRRHENGEELLPDSEQPPLTMPVNRRRVRERSEPTRHAIDVKDWNIDAAAHVE